MTTYYLNNISNVLNLILWIMAVIGNVMMTILLNKGEHKDGKLCMPNYIEAKHLAAFLGVAIVLQAWTIAKLVMAPWAPFFCGETISTLMDKSLKDIFNKNETKEKSPPTPIFLKMFKFAGISLLCGFVAFSMYACVKLIERLNDATVVDGMQCIVMSDDERKFINALIYFVWIVLTFSAVYTTYFDFWCPL